MRHAIPKDVITDVIADLNRSLAQDFRVTPLAAPDAPIFMAVAWPLAEGVTGLKPRLPAGRGITLPQALRAAGAEAVELRASLAQNHLTDLAQLPRDQGRRMVPATDLLSGDTVLLPAQLVYLDHAGIAGEVPYADANSTGCATGPTRAEAILMALLECLERDATALWWHGPVAPAALPLDLIDALQPRLLWWLQERPRRTRLLDLTTDTGVPVVAAISSDPDGRSVATGVAARFDPATAALAAVTEMVQTEAAMTRAAAARDPEYLRWLDHACTHTMPQFQPQPRPPAALAADITAALTRLSDLGHRALVVDLTLPADPLPTVRVVVPGLCALQGRINVPRFARLTGHLHPPDPHILAPEPY